VTFTPSADGTHDFEGTYVFTGGAVGLKDRSQRFKGRRANTRLHLGCDHLDTITVILSAQ
jgi:Uri superfamily endonuclease